MRRGERAQLLSTLIDLVESVSLTHPTRLAVDGPPAAGKTTLADELAVVLRAGGRDVIRSTIEGFLFPQAHRYRRGEYSAQGCYYDNHDYEALNRLLLDPLGPGGDRRVQPAIYDWASDGPVSVPVITVPAEAVLVFDGVFLMRPELAARWDLAVLVSTSFTTTVERAQLREKGVWSEAEIERRWRERYIPSQEYYFARVNPAQRADVVVHNDDLERPGWQVRLR